MKLIEILRQLQTLDRELTIYARHPWTPSADAQLAVEGSAEEQKAKADELRYFLEVFIARDFLDDWRATQHRAPTDEQSCARLIEYATNDA